MSAFGRRGGNGGPAGGRPSFGIASPMKGGPGSRPAPAAVPEGGEQFPPLDSIEFNDADSDSFVPSAAERGADAMTRLADRQAASS